MPTVNILDLVSTSSRKKKKSASRFLVVGEPTIALLCLVSCLFIALASAMPLSAGILDVQVSWDAEDEPLNIGDIIHFKVTTDGPGSVVVDISTVRQSIQLYDNGTNGDTIADDRVYELDYVIFEGDTVEEGPILAGFVADDGTETWINPEDRDMAPRMTIDGTRPVVTNDGVSPDPFNPNTQNAYIRYVLTESSSVTIKIYGDRGQLIRTLGTPSGRAGENHTTWNGADDLGRIAGDGIYTYEITASDRTGNFAIPTKGGCILSTVEMAIDNSLVAPNPFSPDGDDVDDVTWISFDIELTAHEEQLTILGFGTEGLSTATTEDDDEIHPYALIGITIFNSSGGAEAVFSHDLTPEADTDFAPNGWPNRKVPPEVGRPGNLFGSPTGLPDYSDENKSNDWDTLVPLHGPFGSSEEPYYAASFSLGWEGEGRPDGTYLISIECELVGRRWEFVEYMKGPGGILEGEKWHAVPSRHHGVGAPSVTKSVIIDRREVVPVDKEPPSVTSTTPSNALEIDPARSRVKEIIAVLDDSAGGSGVDPIESSISLSDPLGNKLYGQQTPFEINSIKLVLESELTVSGEYTIEVIPVDKRGNKAQEASVFKFVLKDTSAPTVVPNTVTPRPTEFDDEGNPIDPYTQPIEEISVVLTDGRTGLGVNLDEDSPDHSTIYLRNSADESIEGELILDMANQKLIYTFEEPLAVSDTYTIIVSATDLGGTKGIHPFQFVIDMAENIEVRHEGRIYLVIYDPTDAFIDLGLVEDSVSFFKTITAEETDSFPAMLPEIAPLTDLVIGFDPYDIELSRAAELTLYYEDSQLPPGIDETELSIYTFKSQIKNWVPLSGAVVSEDDNKLTANISYIDQYYVIAYASPVAVSLEKEISLDPPKYFNPDRDSLTFTFPSNMTDYQVQIYNVAGDRIIILEEQLRPDNSLVWDGRNEDDEMVRNGIFICRILSKVEGRIRSLNKLIAVVR